MLLVVELLRWWYTDGWARKAHNVRGRIDGALDYFSISLLLKTLFSPFRQISAGRVDGPLNIKMRAFVDRLFSRVIGAVVRTLIIIIGLVTILITVVIGAVWLLVWALMPLLPILGVYLSINGVLVG